MNLTVLSAFRSPECSLSMQQQFYVAAWQPSMNRTDVAFIDENRPGNRLYANEREIHLIPKSLGWCIGEYLLSPVIKRIQVLASSIPEILIGVGCLTERVYKVFNSLPALPSVVASASAYEIGEEEHVFCSFGCQGDSIWEEEEKSGTLSERQLQHCGSLFSIPAETLHQGTCFEAAYQACQGGEGDFEQIRMMSHSLLNSEGRSLLWEAVHRGDFFLARKLMYQKIAIHTQDPDKNGSIHLAVRLGDSKLVELLREFNSLVVVNKHGQNPLHIAAEYGHAQIAAYLIDHGIPHTATSTFISSDFTLEKISPIHLAVIHGHHALLKTLLDKLLLAKKLPGTVEVQIAGIGHLLHLSLYFQNDVAFQLLLTRYHAYTQHLVNTGNEQGITPTIMASQMGNWRAIQLLRRKQAFLEASDHSGRTAVHWAVITKQKSSLAILDHYGCNLEPTDAHGDTPLKALEKNAMCIADREMAAYLKDRILQRKAHLSHHLKSCHPEGLVFKGGGPKGVAYTGAVAILERGGSLDELLWVGGTSAGSIISALLACDYTANDINQLMDMDFTEFLDHPFTLENFNNKLRNISLEKSIAALRKLYNYATNSLGTLAGDVLEGVKSAWVTLGVCKGENFRKWIENLISSRVTQVVGGDKAFSFVTFGELKQWIDQGFPFKHLHIMTTNLEAGTLDEISSQDPKWAHVIISDAVRASMSIPLLFEPHRLHYKNARGERTEDLSLGLHVDGGLLRNFPIGLFDRMHYLPIGVDPSAPEKQKFYTINQRTLGLSLFSPKERQLSNPQVIQNLKDLAKAIGSIYVNAEEEYLRQIDQNRYRTIEIDNQDVSLFEFDLNIEKRSALVRSGREDTSRFLSDCPSSIIKTLRENRSIHPKLIKKWSERLRLLNEANPEALEWIVISSFLQPDEIPIQWLKRWFEEKDLQMNQNKFSLDLDRENNFVAPFNSTFVEHSIILRRNLWRLLVDLKFFHYNENTQTLVLDQEMADVVQEIVLKHKETVRDWVIEFWPLLKRDYPQKWIQQCRWISQYVTNTSLFSIQCG